MMGIYLKLARPEQWSKNVFLLAGLIFGHKLTDPTAVTHVLLGFACFSLVASAVYVFNDIHDREEDRLHPRKKNRPIASGRVPVGSAVFYSLGLACVGLLGAALLNPAFLIVTATYLVMQVLYTLWLKHAALLDVILIGVGFVLRAVAGAVLAQVAISPWLVVCTFTLCLFMGFSKRRCELNALALNGANGAAQHRRTLAAYTPELLNHMTTVTAGIAVVSFMLYAMDARTYEVYHTRALIYTLPLVVYAVFRFALLVEHGRVDGPTDVLIKDRPFQIALLLWALAVVLIVYGGAEMTAKWQDLLRAKP